MRTLAEKMTAFRALHARTGAFVIPNPWDIGSARLLASLGFEALATTSAGFAWTRGKPDGGITRDEALGHAREIAQACDLPVNADLENCFAHEPAGVAETIRLAGGTGICGASIEDSSGDAAKPIYDFELAVERVKAGIAAARALSVPLIITARAENFLHGRKDLADTIARLKAYEAVGADVLYAPGLVTLDEIRAVTSAVTKPVNVLMGGGSPDLTLSDLAAAGAKRISIGGAMARAALGALLRAGREIKEHGTFTYTKEAAPSAQINATLKGWTTS
jgi:2-methylisocitrate lyase-like PEP mutase family enzyme